MLVLQSSYKNKINYIKYLMVCSPNKDLLNGNLGSIWVIIIITWVIITNTNSYRATNK